MKLAIGISVGLNLALAGGLVFAFAEQRKGATVPAPVAAASAKVETPMAPAAPTLPGPSLETAPSPFRWSQLMGANNDYRLFVANLRASGCPETTVDDIVLGDTDRAFRWERKRLGLDGSGDGPWSMSRENELIASLLGEPSGHSAATAVAAMGNAAQETHAGDSGETASTQAAVSKSPLFLQDVDWDSMGFTPNQQAAIAQVRQQYQNAVQNQNSSGSGAQNSSSASGQSSSGTTGQNSSDTTGQSSFGTADPNSTPAGQNGAGASSSDPSQTALADAEQQLRNALGAQAYAAYEQEQYLKWYQAQVTAAGGGPMVLNPGAFSP